MTSHVRMCAVLMFTGLAGQVVAASAQPPLAIAGDRRGEPVPMPVVLIDHNLNVRETGLIKAELGPRGAGTVTVVDTPAGSASRQPESISTTDLLAIAPAGWIVELSSLVGTSTPTESEAAPRRVPRAFIELVDGQRFVGSPALQAEQGDRITWTHPRLGDLRIPLDVVSRLVLRPAVAAKAPPPHVDATGDEVLLLNGDRVRGFVENAGAIVTVSPPKPAPGLPQPASIDIPLDQVASLTLTNPKEALRGVAVWLEDGSIVAGAGIEFDAAGRKITIAGGSADGSAAKTPAAGASLDVATLRGIVPKAERLIPLAALPVAREAPTGDRRTFEPVRISSGELPAPLGAEDVVLPGPMVVEWTLPAGADRLAGWLVLEERFWAWGDCEVTIFLAAGEDDPSPRLLMRDRLNARRPIAPVNVPLMSGGRPQRLRVIVDAGEHGPVQDQLVLRNFLISRPDVDARAR